MDFENKGLNRRQWVAAGAAAALGGLVTGCGGGGGAGPAREVVLEASTLTPGIGQRVQLTARFDAGRARIEPGIGAVLSGQPVQTPVLDRPGTQSFTLTVEIDGQAAQQRQVQLTVAYRDRYEALPGLPATAYHAATLAADGSVIVTGGSRGGNVLSDAIDRFDPVTRSYTRIGSLRTGQADHTATLLADGRILVLGGNTSVNVGSAVIDPRDGSVIDGGRLNASRSWHATVALPDGRALVVGGLSRDSVEIWEPAARRFRLVGARMRHSREYPSATLLNDGRVLIAGGAHVAAVNTEFEIFDPGTERFEVLDTGIQTRRTLHRAHRLSDGRVLLLGGESYVQGDIALLNTVLRFDPVTNAVSALAPLDLARSLTASVLLPNDEVLLFGGETPGQSATSSASGYRPGQEPAARALTALPAGRTWHSATRLTDGRVLVLGGESPSGLVTGSSLYE